MSAKLKGGGAPGSNLLASSSSSGGVSRVVNGVATFNAQFLVLAKNTLRELREDGGLSLRVGDGLEAKEFVGLG